MSEDTKDNTETYFFKCTVKSITYAQGGMCEVDVVPFKEYSLTSGDETYVAFVPTSDQSKDCGLQGCNSNGQSATVESCRSGILLKYTKILMTEEGENLLRLFSLGRNYVVYVKNLEKDESKKYKIKLKSEGKTYGVTKVTVEV